MQILAIRPQPGGNTLARFDVQLPNGMRLFNLALKEGQNGRRVFAPSAFGMAAATFTHEIAELLIELASNALGEMNRHDSRKSAA